MARSVEFDAGELSKLYADLSGAPVRVQFNAGQAVRKGARLIDREMKRDARGHEGNYFGRPGTEFATPLENHVSHEMTGPLEAEIGIEAKGAGKIAHIIVFGSANNSPVYDHTAGPRRALPAIEKVMADAAEDSVLGDKR